MPRKIAALPADASIVRRAAHAFHHAAAAALELDTAKQMAAVIGEAPAAYSNCLRGRSGSLDRVHGWIVRLAERGVRLEMKLTADGVTVSPG